MGPMGTPGMSAMPSQIQVKGVFRNLTNQWECEQAIKDMGGATQADFQRLDTVHHNDNANTIARLSRIESQIINLTDQINNKKED